MSQSTALQSALVHLIQKIDREERSPKRRATVIALADKFQANAPHRTLAQWDAMVADGVSDSLWDDDDERMRIDAIVIVRDRLASRGVQ